MPRRRKTVEALRPGSVIRWSDEGTAAIKVTETHWRITGVPGEHTWPEVIFRNNESLFEVLDSPIRREERLL